MRTLGLLAALLLAFLAQTQTMEKRVDMDSTKDQPEDNDEDIAVSFTEVRRYSRDATGPKEKKVCRCGRGLSCRSREREVGRCTLHKRIYKLCCK